jgi:excisionase family DNA binding protein
MHKHRIPADKSERLKLIDVGELANLFGVSRHTILRWCRDGRLPRPLFLTDGGGARWRVSQLEKWLDKLQVRRRKRPVYQGAVRRQMGGDDV